MWLMTVLSGNVWFLRKYLQRCVEAHFQQLSLQCSYGTLCLLITLEDDEIRKPLKDPFAIMLAQLKTVKLVREAIKLAFL